MKYFLPIIVACLVFTSCEHTKHIYKKTKFPSPFEFTMADSTQSGTKDQLYDKAHKWMTTTKGLNVFTVEKADKASGVLEGKGKLTFNTRYIYLFVSHEIINYKIKIKVGDGKFLCTFTDFVHESKGVKNGSTYKNEKPKYYDYSLGNLTQEDPKSRDKKRWDKIKLESQKEARRIIRSFKNAESR